MSLVHWKFRIIKAAFTNPLKKSLAHFAVVTIFLELGIVARWSVKRKVWSAVLWGWTMHVQFKQ